ncbi:MULTISPECIES: hypothetical protein [Microbacterium]|uniref:Leucyl-tRNA synthetase n=1 Tax=Microbacterium wangchenii TaxID=2541726 RepID=A0ABX5SWR3_9MICO|nr:MULTISPECIES: hypothetical protein [Microbacterium]MCK6067480.1 hypothetical protein [Microbacterium sp. EYE_512]QBR89587.1 hypothetical protein E4K62_13415 [Microbacterium wangchenii]TFV80937.1 hypothetical protein E4V99_17695 [Microbacterium sp. dk485]TXK16815.1 hypothetical protein FVP99_09100 [Microbacterium wangchenii]
MTNAIEAIVEILSWIGLGMGALVALLALVVHLVDGTWVPVRAFVEHEGDEIVLRWFDEEDAVNSAPISAAQWRELGGRDTAEVFARRGSRNRVRAARHSGAVRGLLLLAAVLLAVGAVCLIISGVMLFVR